MTGYFLDVTEIEGQRISSEQLLRTAHRYRWAASLCRDHDVLEVACGAGQGLGLLAASAASVTAGDYSPEVLAVAQRNHSKRAGLTCFGAEELPFADNSFDSVLLFEALYYVEQPAAFFAEARRVLRPGGQLLVVTANKDLFDFTPSPYSKVYLGVAELTSALAAAGFAPTFAALIDTCKVPLRQRLLRPVKTLVSRLGLMPTTMHGKAWMKRIFFGEMAVMPADLADCPIDYHPPLPIPAGVANLTHKVLYCRAELIG